MIKAYPKEIIPIIINNDLVNLEIIPSRAGDTLFRISKEDAVSNGEAEVQIFEGCTYEYVLSDSAYRLSTDVKGVVNPSRKDEHRETYRPIFMWGRCLFMFVIINILSRNKRLN
jgi:hypothetical protein